MPHVKFKDKYKNHSSIADFYPLRRNKTCDSCNQRSCLSTHDFSLKISHQDLYKPENIMIKNPDALRHENMTKIIRCLARSGVQNIILSLPGKDLTDRMLLQLLKIKWALRLRRVLRAQGVKEPSVQFTVNIILSGLQDNVLLQMPASKSTLLPPDIKKKISRAQRVGLPVSVTTFVSTRRNAKALVPLYQELLRLKVSSWIINPLMSPALPADDPDIVSEKSLNIREMLDACQSVIADYLSSGPDARRMNLVIPPLFDSAMLSGNALPGKKNIALFHQYRPRNIITTSLLKQCLLLREIGENLFESDAITVSDDAADGHADDLDFKELSIADLSCCSCRYRNLWRGDHPTQAHSVRALIRRPDPICCYLSLFLENKLLPIYPQSLRNEILSRLDAYGTPPAKKLNI